MLVLLHAIEHVGKRPTLFAGCLIATTSCHAGYKRTGATQALLKAQPPLSAALRTNNQHDCPFAGSHVVGSLLRLAYTVGVHNHTSAWPAQLLLLCSAAAQHQKPSQASHPIKPTMCSEVSRVTMLQTVSTSSGLLPSTSPSFSSCRVASCDSAHSAPGSTPSSLFRVRLQGFVKRQCNRVTK